MPLIAVGDFVIPTTATNTASVTGLSFKPNCVIFFASNRTAFGTGGRGEGEQVRSGYGIAISPTERVSVGTSLRRNTTGSGGSNQSGGGLSTDACFRFAGSGAGDTEDGRIDLQSFNSDGFTVICDVTFDNTSSWVVSYIAFQCPDLALIEAVRPTGVGVEPYTGAGFKPDALMMLGIGDRGVQMGFSDGVNEICQSWDMNSGGAQSTPDTYMHTSSARFISGVEDSAAAVVDRASVDSLDSDGFSLDWVEVNGTDPVYWVLCMRGMQFAAGAITLDNTPSNTGSISSLSFQPHGLIMIGNDDTVADNTLFGSEERVVMLGVADESESRMLAMRRADGGLSSGATDSYRDDRLINDHSGAREGTLQSFDPTGFTIFEVDGLNTYRWFAMAPILAGGPKWWV